MKRLCTRLWIGVLLLLGTATAQAQYGYRFGGEVMQQAALSPDAMARLSQHQPLGTARSMAMAGAFVSLGGDMASMSINPAGLGMYRSNEFSVTPLVTLTQAKNSVASYGDNNRGRVSLGNLGFLFNLYEGTGHLVSLNLGLGYNRLADLNYSSAFHFDSPYGGGATAAPSLLNVLAGQLTVNGLYPNSEEFLGYYGDNYPDLWSAMMAYNSYLINPQGDGEGRYWEADRVGHNANVGHFYQLESRGSIGEYNLSLAMNIDNKLYLGATFSIQSISQHINLYYGEDYLYGPNNQHPALNASGEELIEQAEYIHLNQGVQINGTGFNLKAGLVYRPLPALRLGVAVHIPTFYTLDHSYAGQMASLCYNPEGVVVEEKENPLTGQMEEVRQHYFASDVNTDGHWEDEGPDAWRVQTPTRLMVGASYTFGNRGVISVDYQCDWYNGIRVRNHPFWIPEAEEYAPSAFKRRFAATHTLRLGAEFKPLARWALRAGFGYTSSQVKDLQPAESSPLADRILYGSLGTGVTITPRIQLDVAYQYHYTQNHAYSLFFGAREVGGGAYECFDKAEPVSTDYQRHNIVLTMAFKF